MNVWQRYIILYAEDGRTTLGFVQINFNQNGQAQVQARVVTPLAGRFELNLWNGQERHRLEMQTQRFVAVFSGPVRLQPGRIVAAVATQNHRLIALGESEPPRANWQRMQMQLQQPTRPPQPPRPPRPPQPRTRESDLVESVQEAIQASDQSVQEQQADSHIQTQSQEQQNQRTLESSVQAQKTEPVQEIEENDRQGLAKELENIQGQQIEAEQQMQPQEPEFVQVRGQEIEQVQATAEALDGAWEQIQEEKEQEPAPAEALEDTQLQTPAPARVEAQELDVQQALEEEADEGRTTLESSEAPQTQEPLQSASETIQPMTPPQPDTQDENEQAQQIETLLENADAMYEELSLRERLMQRAMQEEEENASWVQATAQPPQQAQAEVEIIVQDPVQQPEVTIAVEKPLQQQPPVQPDAQPMPDTMQYPQLAGPYGPYWQWREVQTPGQGLSYLLGEAHVDGQIQAVAVAVPGVYAPAPPAHLQGFQLFSNGYWVLAQDAKTGDLIPIED